MSLAPDSRRAMYVSDGPVTHEAQPVERHAKWVIGEGLLFPFKRFRFFAEIR